MDRLQEIEHRLNATTPGKWYIIWAEDDCEDTCIISDLQNEYGEDTYICQTSYEGLGNTQKHNVNEDAEFIAHAKGDIEYLLNIIKAL